MKIDVLDHGYVRLVDSMGDDLSIVRAARVSHDADWRTGEDEGKDEKLIRYLMKNRHTSPFEAVTLTFEIKAPIFVVRQWHRHRTWSYNEVSARYTELPEEFYVPDPNLVGEQSKVNHQSRDMDMVKAMNEVQDYAKQFCEALRGISSENFACYKSALEEGVPRELARCFLGLNTYTRYFGTVNLHNLFHFLRLRLDSHAQYEIRVYAETLLALVGGVAPVASQAFQDSLRGEL